MRAESQCDIRESEPDEALDVELEKEELLV
jgi:hypothetical protein